MWRAGYLSSGAACFAGPAAAAAASWLASSSGREEEEKAGGGSTATGGGGRGALHPPLLSGSGTRPAPRGRSAPSRPPASPAPRGREDSISAGLTRLWGGLEEGAEHLPSLQATPYLPAGLGGDLEGRLECPPLLRGQDGAGPLGSLMVLPLLGSLP